MEWNKRGANYMLSSPPGFAINKSTERGRVTYCAVKLGTPWKPRANENLTEPKGWDGSRVIHVERDMAPDQLAAGLQRCKEACEQCE